MKSVGALQTMLAWAEDRALLRSTLSADPGAKTGARAEHTSALRLSTIAPQQLRDWHQRDKPSRHDAATSGPRCRSPLNCADRTKFHFRVNQDTAVPSASLQAEAEPRRRPSIWTRPTTKNHPGKSRGTASTSAPSHGRAQLNEHIKAIR